MVHAELMCQFAGRSDHLASAHTAASHPDRKSGRVVIAAISLLNLSYCPQTSLVERKKGLSVSGKQHPATRLIDPNDDVSLDRPDCDRIHKAAWVI
jgi:hypothetical protein